jgi:hypothetical protein
MSAALESAPWRTDSVSLMSTQGATVSFAADEPIVELWRSFGLQLTERTRNGAYRLLGVGDRGIRPLCGLAKVR